jgi:hypothetical protein
MKTSATLRFASAVLMTLAFQSIAASAQPKDSKPSESKEPGKKDKQHARADPNRIGDPYPLDSCPISGRKLGSMGDPIVKLYDGREVRFCCDACPPKFEKDLTASMAALDEKIIKDQAPLYPIKTSVVTGKPLPEKPLEFVYGNRLIRVADAAEKAQFLSEPKKYIADLDKAVVAAQSKDLKLTKCPVSGDAYGGDMGEPVNMVVAGRLIRFCCKDCKADLEKNPAKVIAMFDDARAGKEPTTDSKDAHHGDEKKDK